MAFLDLTDDEDKNKDQTASTTAAGTPNTTLSTETAGVAPTAPGQSSSTSNTPALNSANGNFADLQRYITQNQGQAENYANKVGGYIQKQGDQARNTVDQSQNTFNTEVNKGVTGVNQNLLSDASLNADKFITNPNDVAELSKEKDAKYSGPTSFETSDQFAPASTAVTKAQNLGNNVNTTAGRSSLLNTFNQNKPYSGGQNSLDQFTIGNNSNALGALQTGASTTADLGTRLQGAAKASNANVTNAQNQQTANNQQITNTLGSANTALQNQVTQNVTAAQTTAQKNADTVKAAITAGQTLTPEQLTQLGLTPEQYQQLQNQQQTLKNYGATPSALAGYLQQNANINDINANTVSTPEQAAKIAALNQLLGTQNNFITQPVTGTPKVPALFGLNYGQANQDYSKAIQNAQAADAAKHGQQALLDQNNKAAKEAKAAQTGSAVGTVAGTVIGTAIGGPIGGAIGGFIGSTVGSLFCHAANTSIKMLDGSVKMIQDIDIGEEIYGGGLVMGCGKVLNNDLYIYNGVTVSGMHAVLENGEWIRVHDSKHAIAINTVQIVYPLVTEFNVIVTADGTVWSDFAEVHDSTGLNDVQRLQVMNDRLKKAA